MNSTEMKKPRKSKKHREAPEEQGLTLNYDWNNITTMANYRKGRFLIEREILI